jgi:dipeptidyl aminopeptidase/acylaminoacyl peptidase
MSRSVNGDQRSVRDRAIARRRWCVVAMSALALASCRDPARPRTVADDDPTAARPEATSQDYADARRSFRTKLLRKEASPQPWDPVAVRSDAIEIELVSEGQKLEAWLSKPGSAPAVRAPAVVFLHGGFAFGEEDWDMSRPFRDAGFVVLMPILRGENGSPGFFSLFYDEVEDVLAAAEALAKRPEVDVSRIFVAGHSAGGTLAMLAAMTSKRFRAMASLSGLPDATVLAEESDLVPFDSSDRQELRMRSPSAFPTSFKCPARLFWGEDETWLAPSTRDLARRARAAGLEVDAVPVPGDHMTMADPAIARAIAFFAQQR